MCLGEKESQKGGQEDQKGGQEEDRQKGGQEEDRQKEDREKEDREKEEALARVLLQLAFVSCNNEIGAFPSRECPDYFSQAP